MTVERGQIWRHWRGGAYCIVEVGISTERSSEGTRMVAYRKIGVSRRKEPETFFRTLDDFLDTVDEPTYVGPRFTRETCDR